MQQLWWFGVPLLRDVWTGLEQIEASGTRLGLLQNAVYI